MSVGEKMIVLGGRDVDGLDIIGFEVTGFYYPLNKCQICFLALFCDTYLTIHSYRCTTTNQIHGSQNQNGKWLKEGTGKIT